MGAACIGPNVQLVQDTMPKQMLKSSVTKCQSRDFREFGKHLEQVQDQYEFIKIIAQNPFATVRLASHKISGLKFAIKSVTKRIDSQQLNMLLRELDILKMCDHPNIIKFSETYEDADHLHIVMEYCSGGQLLSRIQHNEKEAATVMQKLFGAIGHLHSLELTHQDIKPHNVLFEDDHQDADIKLIDFGLSKKFGGPLKKTIKNESPYFISPEVLKDEYSQESDM